MKAAKFAIAFTLIAAVTHADERYEQNFNRTLAYRGGRVTIENRFGPIDIRTGSGRNVIVRATIRSSDAELGKNIRIETSDGPGGISIKTVMPSVISRHGHLSFSIDYDPELGKNIRIETSAGPGGISIKTVMPSVISRHGHLSFSIDYDVVVPDEAPLYGSNHFGEINAAGIRAASE